MKLYLYLFYFKDNQCEWVQPVIADSAREAKKLGYKEWCMEDEYINSRVRKVNIKADIEGLQKGCLNLSNEEYVKRNIAYYGNEDGFESISEGIFLFRF